MEMESYEWTDRLTGIACRVTKYSIHTVGAADGVLCAFREILRLAELAEKRLNDLHRTLAERDRFAADHASRSVSQHVWIDEVTGLNLEATEDGISPVPTTSNADESRWQGSPSGQIMAAAREILRLSRHRRELREERRSKSDDFNRLAVETENLRDQVAFLERQNAGISSVEWRVQQDLTKERDALQTKLDTLMEAAAEQTRIYEKEIHRLVEEVIRLKKEAHPGATLEGGEVSFASPLSQTARLLVEVAGLKAERDFFAHRAAEMDGAFQSAYADLMKRTGERDQLQSANEDLRADLASARDRVSQSDARHAIDTQADIDTLLDTLGLSTTARSGSPSEVMRETIIPAVRQMAADLDAAILKSEDRAAKEDAKLGRAVRQVLELATAGLDLPFDDFGL